MTTHRDSRPCDRRQTPRRGATSLVAIVGLLVAFVATTVSTSPAAPSLAATTPPPISSTGVSLMSTTPFASSVTVSAGSSNTCAIDDQGILYCWGSGTSVGDGTGDPRKIPTRVVAGGGMTNTGTVSAVTSGSSHNCAIEGGIVYCWGYNLNGQLGDNSTTARATPVKVNAAGGMANNGTVSAIAAGGDFTCAIEGGVLYCWGLAGKIGNGNLGSQTPLKVSVSASGMTNNGTVSAVSTGAAHSCAIEGTAAGNDAVLFCWGGGGSGQLGLGINSADTPAKVLANDGFLNAGTVSAVSAGLSHTCALQGGTAYCWGGNGAGELGIGTTTNTTLAAHVQPTADIPNTAVTQIAAGDQFTCAIEAGVAGCWGYGYSGRLGSGSNTDVSTAVKVATGTEGFTNAGNVLALSITSNYASRACAVESTVSGNRLYCWGDNNNGQLGVGDTTNTNVPKQVCTVCASSGSSSSSSSGSIPPPPPPTTTTAPTTTVPPTTTPPVGPRPVTAPTAGQQPSLITADDVETVEARPGQGGATIDGAPVAVTVTRIDSPAASVPADQRTSEQIAELRRAAADLVDAFNEGAPDPTTPLVTVTDTDTGAVLNGVLVDPEDATTPVPVPVEDVVIIDATTTKVLLAGADDQGRPEQVEGGVLEVVDGGYVAALAYGLPAGAPGEVVILSTPTLMGTFTTGADGSFAGQLALPADLEPGDHTVVLTAGGITTSLGVRVAATGETEIVDTTTTVPVAAPVELPATGPTRTGTHLALWAMVLTALGAALVMRRRHLV